MIPKCQLMWENFNFQEVKVGFRFIHHRVGLGFCFNVPLGNLPVHQTLKQAQFSCLVFSLIQMICLHCLSTGVDPDYDGALADIKATNVWFDQYLKKQCSVLGCRVSA